MASGSLRRVLQLKLENGKIVGEDPMVFDQDLPSIDSVLERDHGHYRVLGYDSPYERGDTEVYVAKVEPTNES